MRTIQSHASEHKEIPLQGAGRKVVSQMCSTMHQPNARVRLQYQTIRSDLAWHKLLPSPKRCAACDYTHTHVQHTPSPYPSWHHFQVGV